MGLQPVANPVTGNTRKERVLLYGPTKVGKTYAALSIAARTGARMFYIDADNTLDASLPEWTDADGNIPFTLEPYQVSSWQEIRDAFREVGKLAGKGDWVVVDLVGTIWTKAQDAYYEKMYAGKDLFDIAEDRLAAAAGVAGASDPSLEGYNWQYVNALYNSCVTKLLLESPAHVLVIAEAEEMARKSSGDLAERDKAKRQTYGLVGWKPVGQKKLGFQVSTILLMRWGAGRTRTLTTVGGDRGRPPMDQVECEDFAVTYLFQTAGWRPS